MKLWGVVVVASLLLVGCGNEPKQPILKDLVEETVDVVEGEEVNLPFVEPFTGVRVEEEKTGRPILVTINNHPQARPQSGLAEADIVYEMIAEGGVTRFLALYQSEVPDVIGPVRSAREYFVTIAQGLDAFYVAHGYSPEAQKMLRAGVVDNINGMQYDGKIFTRSNERRAPHNSYTSKEQLEEAFTITEADDTIRKQPAYVFADDESYTVNGEAATKINVAFDGNSSFQSEYVYDAGSGTYSRAVQGVVTADKDTNEQVALSNVVCIEVEYSTIDAKGRQKLYLENGGRAFVFQQGKMKEVEWQLVDDMIVPIENGQPMKLNPGKTWINLLPPSLDRAVTYTP